jgi:hypothetical protein
MGAAQSRHVPITGTCDNTLSRLELNVFIVVLKPFCEQIEFICNDYLGRSLNAIVYHALIAYIQKHYCLAKNAKDIMAELVADVTTHLEGFIKDVRKLREIVTRMNLIAKDTGPASFLEQLSENPICRHILSQMGCKIGIVGGQFTRFKEVFGQECWRNGKLNTFFGNLASYLKKTFSFFHVISTSQIELKGELLQLSMKILEDPEFGKEELSPVAMAIRAVFLEIKLEQLNPSDKPKNVRGA